MTIITYTQEQADAIVGMWNDAANADSQLDAIQAWLVINGDNFDYDILESGYSTIEVSKHESKTGNPETFVITDTDLTIE